MKKKKVMYYIFMFLPLLIVAAALPFLPEQIPAHYGFDNQVTRWGSKYEALLYPVVTIGMGYFLLAMARLAARQEESGKNNENVVLAVGIILLIQYNAMTLHALYTDFYRVEDLSEVSLSIYQISFGILGIFMIVTGNIMPKLRMNSLIGLRTRWSMKNEVIWKKSQRFGGISFIIGGIAILAVCLLTGGMTCFWCAMGILAALACVDICYTYTIAHRKDLPFKDS